MPTIPPRHERQTRFAPLGLEGQEAIARGRVVVVGCGALGSVASEMLARAGVASLRLIDRDVLELCNLHRQSLFTEQDVHEGLPKPVAAAARLRAIDPAVEVEPVVADFDGANALALLQGASCVLDATDNFEARHVINEACLETRTPWVHAACLGATALAWAVVPGGACYACLVPDAPSPGEVATCETSGIIGPAVHLAAGVQVAEALKILAGRTDALLPGPWTLDAWTGRGAVVRAQRDPSCGACVLGQRRFLGRPRRAETVACGRGAVQLRPFADGEIDLDPVEARLRACGPVVRNRWLVRLRADERDVTVFRDGRVLVSGTREPGEARALAARYLGA